jgi:hypothetical protein
MSKDMAGALFKLISQSAIYLKTQQEAAHRHRFHSCSTAL